MFLSFILFHTNQMWLFAPHLDTYLNRAFAGHWTLIPHLSSAKATSQKGFCELSSQHGVGGRKRRRRRSLPFLLESRRTLLGLTAGWSSVSVDILGLPTGLDSCLRLARLGSAGRREGPLHGVSAGCARAWAPSVRAGARGVRAGHTGSWEREGLQP